MNWTKELPTQPDYYNHRRSPVWDAALYRVFADGTCQNTEGGQCDTKKPRPVRDVGGEWFGPLNETYARSN